VATRRSKTRKRASPPSRVRYEGSHPVLSVRVPKELADQLREIRRQSGKTLGDIIREALGAQEPSTKGAYATGYLDSLGKCLDIVEGCRRCYEQVCELIPDDA